MTTHAYCNGRLEFSEPITVLVAQVGVTCDCSGQTIGSLRRVGAGWRPIKANGEPVLSWDPRLAFSDPMWAAINLAHWLGFDQSRYNKAAWWRGELVELPKRI